MRKFGTKDSRLVGTARNLRSAGTDVERDLWYRLRNRQLEGCKFRRQHPVAGYVLDFACEELMLGVELDGGQHGDEAAVHYDQKRTECLQQAGWKILRFWNSDVTQNIDGVLTVIMHTIREAESC